MKKCSKCNEFKEFNKFSKDCTKGDGLCNTCKSCKSEYKKIYRNLNGDKINNYTKKWKENYFIKNGKAHGTKYSPKELEQRKLLAIQLKSKRKLKNKKQQKRYTEITLIQFNKASITHKKCKDCKRSISVKDFHKCNYRGHIYSDRCKYCQSQLSEIRKIKGIRKLEYANYRKTDLYKVSYNKLKQTDKYKMNSIRRRERKNLNVESDHVPSTLIKAVKDKFNYKCFQCDANIDLCLDHHYPLSNGYKLTINNAVLLCRSCNSKKGRKLPEDYYNYAEIDRLTSMGINTNKVYEYSNGSF